MHETDDVYDVGDGRKRPAQHAAVQHHAGENLHHIVEISFKAFAKALRQATELDPRASGVPSTKGTLG